MGLKLTKYDLVKLITNTGELQKEERVLRLYVLILVSINITSIGGVSEAKVFIFSQTLLATTVFDNKVVPCRVVS